VIATLEQLNPNGNGLGAFQFDHSIISGETGVVDVGTNDVPTSPAYAVGRANSFSWRSLERLPKAGCELKAKGNLDTGCHVLLKLPIMNPFHSLDAEGCPFQVVFQEMKGIDLELGCEQEEATAMPYITICGDCCTSNTAAPVVGNLSPNFTSSLEKVSQKGSVIDEVWQTLGVTLMANDLDYLRTQRVHIIVRDYAEQQIYGHCLYSLSAVCDAAPGEAVPFNVVLNNNGRLGGRLQGKVSLHRVGGPAPAPALMLEMPTRKAGEQSAFDRLRQVAGGGGVMPGIDNCDTIGVGLVLEQRDDQGDQEEEDL